MKTVIVVDAFNLFMRHYIAHPAMSDNGEQIGGIIGFLYTLVNFVEKYRPDEIYVVWESGGSSRRRALQKDYKRNSRPQKLNRNYEDIPDSIRNRNYQIRTIIEVIKHMPIGQIYVPDCEADDVIGYLCRHKLRNDRKVIISSDKDYYQLLDSKTIIYSPTWKKLVTSKEVKEKFKISPSNFCLAKCMTGDPSDNVAGIRGVGFKSLANRFKELGTEEDVTIDRIVSEARARVAAGSNVKIYERIVDGEGTIRNNWKIVYLDVRNISATQVKKINETISTFTPSCNKLNAIRFFIKEGITNFNFDRAYLAFSSLR